VSSAGTGASEAPGKTGKPAGGEGRCELTGESEPLAAAVDEVAADADGDDDGDDEGAVEQPAMRPAVTRSRPMRSRRGIEILPPRE